VGARTSVDWNKLVARNFARKMEVMENMVRARVESGGRLTADEIVRGVTLSHEEFLRLFDLARPALWRDAQ
jgi:hypothetical protein